MGASQPRQETLVFRSLSQPQPGISSVSAELPLALSSQTR